MPKRALILVDVQVGLLDQSFDDTWGGNRWNGDAEQNIRRLVSAWMDAGWPIVLVRHDSLHPDSPLHPSKPSNALAPWLLEAVPSPLALIPKSVNSSFTGTQLEEVLRGEGLTKLVVAGITTNHCCETTTRVGGNRGFDIQFALDATSCFDRPTHDDPTKVVPAATIAQVTAANLHGEFATVMSTDDVIAKMKE
jgi:nicotinamidase-related amidase